MALESEERKLLIKLLQVVADHKKLLAAIAIAITQHNEYIHMGMQKCEIVGCNEISTVENEMLTLRVCDNCAARAVVNGLKMMASNNLDSKLIPVFEAAARVELWKDVKAASAIRLITEHYRLFHYNDEPEIMQ